MWFYVFLNFNMDTNENHKTEKRGKEKSYRCKLICYPWFQEHAKNVSAAACELMSIENEYVNGWKT